MAFQERTPWLIKLLERSYYVDELYAAIIVKPLKLLGSSLMVIDAYVIGGIVRLTGAAVSSAGRAAARLQNGQVQAYGLAAVIGFVILVAAIVGRRFLP